MAVTKKHVKATLEAAMKMLKAVENAVDTNYGTTAPMDPDKEKTVKAAGLAVGRKTGQSGGGCSCS